MTFVFFPHRNKLSYFPCHSLCLLCRENNSLFAEIEGLRYPLEVYIKLRKPRIARIEKDFRGVGVSEYHTINTVGYWTECHVDTPPHSQRTYSIIWVFTIRDIGICSVSRKIIHVYSERKFTRTCRPSTARFHSIINKMRLYT